MGDPPRRPATYDDLCALPPNMVGQILFGVLHAHPRPAPKHARASTTLGEELGPPFNRGRGGPGGWVILHQPELHLGPHVLVPDMAGWRRERLPELPEKAYFELAPDWACEVLSPSTASLDRGDKRKVYGTFEVKHLWFVDPEARTLEVFELETKGYRLVEVYSNDARVRAVPFDAVEIELGALWAR
ncbi:Uma2 family endonuclease [Labilithrix luteola]|uniref:Uma2 family endonuclease n=1 Tax=Labilithrix luteola TaxID=1391654 RepID=UPI000A81C8EA|nr:Uma2 family endonuclease [Labilithrix luteola]